MIYSIHTVGTQIDNFNVHAPIVSFNNRFLKDNVVCIGHVLWQLILFHWVGALGKKEY